MLKSAAGSRRTGVSWASVCGLVVTLAASVVMFAPSLQSSFNTDDYLFLRTSEAVRDGGLWDAVMYNEQGPGGPWRPLSVLTFVVMHRIVGDDPTPFHVLMLLAHLASIVIVWLLARRIIGGTWAPVLAAACFAVHPAGFASVSWIAALNSVALPFALLAWWLLSADGPEPIRATRIVAASALFAVALGFRETAAVFLVPMLGLEVLRITRYRLPPVKSLARFSPLVVLTLVDYALSRWAVRDQLYGELTQSWPSNAWAHLRRALLPVGSDSFAGAEALQTILGASLIVLFIVVVGLRWWTTAVLVGSFLVSVLAYAVVVGGDDPRYFYFPAALLGLALASVASNVRAALPAPIRQERGWLTAAAVLIVAVVLVAGTTLGHRDVSAWSRSFPEDYDDFVAQLREQVGDPAPGTKVYVANLPIELALFDGYYLDVVTDVVWPDRDVQVEMVALDGLDRVVAEQGDSERVVVFRPDELGCAARRESAEPAPFAAAYDVTMSPAIRAGTVELVRFGPFGDLFGTVGIETDGDGRYRTTVQVPWFPADTHPGRPIDEGEAVRIVVLPSQTELAYDVIVDGEPLLKFGSVTSAESGMTSITPRRGPFGDITRGMTIDQVELSPCRPS